MYIETNNVLSRIFALNGLKFNEKGLFYPIRNTAYDVFITNDMNKVCKLIDLDKSLIEKANYEEFFDMVCQSKFFFKSKFIEDASKGECHILTLMAEYLNAREVVSKKREKLELTTLFAYFKDEDFGNQYAKYISVVTNKAKINKKYSGSTILFLKPNYDRTKLSITMPFFKSTMSDIDFQYFILMSSHEEIVDKFELATNHLI